MELERLEHIYDVLDNCEHNVAVLTSQVEVLHSSMAGILGMESTYSLDVPQRPNTHRMNRQAWLYVTAVFKWLKKVVDDGVDFGVDYSLTDDMGNPVTTVAIWIPDKLAFNADDFQAKVNRNWELVGEVFDQLNKNMKTMYQ